MASQSKAVSSQLPDRRIPVTSADAVASAELSATTGLTPNPGSVALIAAWGALLALLITELIALTLPFDAAYDLPYQNAWTHLLFFAQHNLKPACITGAAAAIALTWPVLRDEFRRVRQESSRLISWRWLGAHLTLLGVLVIGTLARRGGRLPSVAVWTEWLMLWVALALATLVTWCFATLPPRFWTRWITRSPGPLLAAAGVGLATAAFGDWAQHLWRPLQRSTFVIVALLLHAAGQHPIVQPADFVIGTPNFTVMIAPACSGIEGIGLVTAFVAIYLWCCRKDLRFPQAFALFPIGIVTIWLLNPVRIAALILIGDWNEEVALKGFHSMAGWLLFNGVAGGLIWMSNRFGLFAQPAEASDAPNPATAFILPLLILLIASMLTQAFSPTGMLYPLGVLASLLIFWRYRAELRALRWQPSLLPIVAGVAVFVLLRWWAPGKALGDAVLGPEKLVLTRASPWLWAGLLAGAVAAPVAEELAFRGYLARRLLATDFELVSFNQFGWISFVGSSIAYGVLHAAWLPATIAGMIYAGLMYRRGLLTDAIVAHVTCSALIVLSVWFRA